MVFIFPLTIWLGVFTLTSLIITFSLGIAMHRFGKNVFRYHRFFAFLTLVLAIIHAALVISRQYY